MKTKTMYLLVVLVATILFALPANAQDNPVLAIQTYVDTNPNGVPDGNDDLGWDGLLILCVDKDNPENAWANLTTNGGRVGFIKFPVGSNMLCTMYGDRIDDEYLYAGETIQFTLDDEDYPYNMEVKRYEREAMFHLPFIVP